LVLWSPACYDIATAGASKLAVNNN
jgi:hypothetical protein